MLPEGAALDGGNWPAPLGSLRNDRRSHGGIAGIGRVAWEAELPAPARAVSAGSGGGVYVAAGEALVAVAGGRVTWTAPAAPFGGCLLLAGGRLVAPDADGLVVRASRDGAALARLSQGGMSSAPAVAGGLVVFAHDGAGGRELRAAALDGTVAWAQPLSRWSPDPPVVDGGTIAVADGPLVRWFSASGATVGEQAVPGEAAILGPLVGLGSGAVLARYEGGSDGGYAICRPSAPPQPVPAHLPLTGPLATDGSRLALRGFQRESSDGRSLQSIDLVALADGNLLRREVFETPVVAIAIEAGGHVAFAASPSQERWDAYRGFPGFGPSTSSVVGLLAGRRLAASWDAPAPVTGPLAVGAQGELLVPAGDRLYALTR